jgi:hypothetical protein
VVQAQLISQRLSLGPERRLKRALRFLLEIPLQSKPAFLK